MKDFLNEALVSVAAVVVPIVAAFLISFINKAKENAIAKTEDTKKKGYITEIATAITDAVAATSQTFVDALKRAGAFNEEAQREAAKMALGTCMSSLSSAAIGFIETAYGDVTEYLASKIEAEVRKQKLEASAVT